MTANTTGGICRAMWCLLIVTHALKFCYGNDYSVENVFINSLNCTYFDCDETSFTAEYNSDGIGCLATTLVITKNFAGNFNVIAYLFQCILDKCETSIGFDTNTTLAAVILGDNAVMPYFNDLGILGLSDDCNCIHKGSYTNVHCPQMADHMINQIYGHFLLKFILIHDIDKSVLIDIHVYIEVL